MPPKKPETVSLAREEYEAFRGVAEDAYPRLVAKHAELVLVQTGQCEQLREVALKIQHQEQLIGLQRELILAMRDSGDKLDVEQLFKAFHHWQVDQHLAREQKRDPLGWRFIKDGIKNTVVSYETRAEYEAAQPKNAGEWNEHTIRRLREENAKLRAETTNTKEELEKLKKLPVPSQIPQPGMK